MLKSYVDGKEDAVDFFSRLKSLLCPHCHCVGFLIKHGFLRGFTEDLSSAVTERGFRFFCSNRNRRKGCGRTFPILHSAFIKNHSITSKILGLFLINILYGMNPLQAFSASGCRFSPSSCYRLFNRVRLAQPRIRSLLLNALHPPDGTAISDPVAQTIRHLLSAFPLSPSPVASFQSRFQVSFI